MVFSFSSHQFVSLAVDICFNKESIELVLICHFLLIQVLWLHANRVLSTSARFGNTSTCTQLGKFAIYEWCVVTRPVASPFHIHPPSWSTLWAWQAVWFRVALTLSICTINGVFHLLHCDLSKWHCLPDVPLCVKFLPSLCSATELNPPEWLCCASAGESQPSTCLLERHLSMTLRLCVCVCIHTQISYWIPCCLCPYSWIRAEIDESILSLLTDHVLNLQNTLTGLTLVCKTFTPCVSRFVMELLLESHRTGDFQACIDCNIVANFQLLNDRSSHPSVCPSVQKEITQAGKKCMNGPLVVESPCGLGHGWENQIRQMVWWWLCNFTATLENKELKENFKIIAVVLLHLISLILFAWNFPYRSALSVSSRFPPFPFILPPSWFSASVSPLSHTLTSFAAFSFSYFFLLLSVCPS